MVTMPDFLKGAFTADTPPSHPLDIALRLGVAVLLGGVVAWIYRFTRGSDEAAPTFPVTLVLLSALIAMVTQVIGDNIARAFSLVGALSIVRFRTVVRDTQDTAFVIFAVVVGMAVGGRDLVVAGVGLVIVGAAAFAMKPRVAKGGTAAALYRLTLRVGLAQDVEALAKPLLDDVMPSRHIVSMNTAKQGLAIEIAYQGALKSGASPEALVKALNRLDGVQSVELVRDSPQLD
jgi:hypothetical protein